MRYLGMDLGTTTLGLAITDKTNTISSPLDILNFKSEDYESIMPAIEEIIKQNKITDIVVGLPKNMDNTLGFASERSVKFSKMLEKFPVKVHLQDERLTTIEATNILKSTGKKKINKKNIIDSMAASIILTSYLKENKNGK